MKFRVLMSLGLTGLMALGVSGAQAADCSTYVNGASATYLNTTNVSIDDANVPSVTRQATDCYGHATFSPNSLANVLNFANTTPLFGGGWNGLLRQDNTGTEANAYLGLTFGITGVGYNTDSGFFTLTITDGNGAAPANLPVQMDLAFTLKAGGPNTGGTDFYFFNDLLLDSANPGSYQVAIMNTNNNGVSTPRDLSDISLLGRDFRTPDCPPNDPFCTPTRVPEPGSLALVGLALAATGLTMRRRNRV